jgi:hypothetical protein
MENTVKKLTLWRPPQLMNSIMVPAYCLRRLGKVDGTQLRKERLRLPWLGEKPDSQQSRLGESGGPDE